MAAPVESILLELLKAKEQLLRLLRHVGQGDRFDVLQIEQFNNDLQECEFQIEIISKKIDTWLWRMKVDRRVSVPSERRQGIERRNQLRRRDDYYSSDKR